MNQPDDIQTLRDIVRGLENAHALAREVALLKQSIEIRREQADEQHERIEMRLDKLYNIVKDGNGSSLVSRVDKMDDRIMAIEKKMVKVGAISEEEIRGKWTFRTKMIEGIPGAIAGAGITTLIYLFRKLVE